MGSHVSIKEGISVKIGNVKLVLRNVETGKIEVRHLRNLVVTKGKEHIAKLMVGTSSDVFDYVGVGDDDTAPAAGDTALKNQIGARKECTVLSTSGKIAKSRTFFGTADNNGTWKEAGWFTALTGGEMLARTLISPTVDKTSAKTATLSWEVTVG